MQGSKVRVKMVLKQESNRVEVENEVCDPGTFFLPLASHCPIYFLGQEMKVGWTGRGMGKGASCSCSFLSCSP